MINIQVKKWPGRKRHTRRLRTAKRLKVVGNILHSSPRIFAFWGGGAQEWGYFCLWDKIEGWPIGVRLESSIHTQTEVVPPLTHTRQVDIHIWLIVADSFDTQPIGYQHIFFIHWNSHRTFLCNTSKSGHMTSAWWWNLLVKLSVNYSTSKHCYVVRCNWLAYCSSAWRQGVINFSWLWSHPTFLLVFKWMDRCMMQR